MKLIVSLAGGSKRFKNAGVVSPKWSLSVNGKSVLERVLDSFSGYQEIVIAVLIEELSILESLLQQFKGKSKILCLPIREVLPGQACTVRFCIEELQLQKETIFVACGDAFYLDTICLDTFQSRNSMIVAELQGNHWSFAQLNHRQEVIKTTEKTRISNYASTGAYAFSSGLTFLEALESELNKIENEFDEYYIAPLYNHLITQGKEVSAVIIDGNSYVSLGTPDEFRRECLTRGWQFDKQLKL